MRTFLCVLFVVQSKLSRVRYSVHSSWLLEQNRVLFGIFTCTLFRCWCFATEFRGARKCFMFCFRFSLAEFMDACRINQLTLFSSPFMCILFVHSGLWTSCCAAIRGTHDLYGMQFATFIDFAVCSQFLTMQSDHAIASAVRRPPNTWASVDRGAVQRRLICLNASICLGSPWRRIRLPLPRQATIHKPILHCVAMTCMSVFVCAEATVQM